MQNWIHWNREKSLRIWEMIFHGMTKWSVIWAFSFSSPRKNKFSKQGGIYFDEVRASQPVFAWSSLCPSAGPGLTTPLPLEALPGHPKLSPPHTMCSLSLQQAHSDLSLRNHPLYAVFQAPLPPPHTHQIVWVRSSMANISPLGCKLLEGRDFVLLVIESPVPATW